MLTFKNTPRQKAKNAVRVLYLPWPIRSLFSFNNDFGILIESGSSGNFITSLNISDPAHMHAYIPVSQVSWEILVKILLRLPHAQAVDTRSNFSGCGDEARQISAMNLLVYVCASG